ncbi:MAG TPA: 5-oxoprolinase subunit PxpB [Segetibacter sp.]|jgi:inhibitor of KinA
MQPTISPLGDSALTVTFGSSIDEETNLKVLSLFRLLKQQDFTEIIDVIPAYASLTIVYNVYEIYLNIKRSPFNYMCDKVEKLTESLQIQKLSTSKVVEIPVCYNPSFGTDLPEMSKNKQVLIEEIVQIHTSTTYHVYMIGFLPGFSYMGTVDEKIATPRKAVPDLKIPAGSVGIAGEQTGIYPFDSPGGWNIIGRTPLKLFNAKADSPCLLQPGDKVRFQPIALNEYFSIKEKS